MSNEQDTSAESAEHGGLLARVGHLTRQLREGLRELGLDRQVAMAAEAIPDSRDRLKYIATMTEQAARRVLDAVDLAQPLQDEIGQGATELEQLWASRGAAGTPPDAELVAATRAYLQEVPRKARSINAQLLEIMMAQDFQDLTGQVIKKMMEVINEVESQLLQVLVDHAPKGAFAEATSTSLQNGPQIKACSTSGVSSQAEADALLESLGF